jgi:hypothetical protein
MSPRCGRATGSSSRNRLRRTRSASLPHEERHAGRGAIEAWLGGIDELICYDLQRDALVGVDGLAHARGRYAITLRLPGISDPISDEGDFLEIWGKEPDGHWRGAEAIWNTRRPPP